MNEKLLKILINRVLTPLKKLEYKSGALSFKKALKTRWLIFDLIEYEIRSLSTARLLLGDDHHIDQVLRVVVSEFCGIPLNEELQKFKDLHSDDISHWLKQGEESKAVRRWLATYFQLQSYIKGKIDKEIGKTSLERARALDPDLGELNDADIGKLKKDLRRAPLAPKISSCRA